MIPQGDILNLRVEEKGGISLKSVNGQLAYSLPRITILHTFSKLSVDFIVDDCKFFKKYIYVFSSMLLSQRKRGKRSELNYENCARKVVEGVSR